MADIKPGMINKDYFQIFLTHLPTGESVNFDGWVTNFSDTFTSSWNPTKAYGRMDDLYTFQGTSRELTLAFDVVASDRFEAAKNIRDLNRLAQFLYPVYDQAVQGTDPLANSQVLKAAPLLKMKYNGLVSDASTGGDLVGFLRGFSYQPAIESGQFFVPGRGSGTPFIAYQVHQVQLQYVVIHTHLTGWAPAVLGDGAGGKRYVFGGDDASNIGDTFPHAISDPLPMPEPTGTPQQTQEQQDDTPEISESDQQKILGALNSMGAFP